MFAGNFAPTGWALCDGNYCHLSEHGAISLLGTFYGGRKIDVCAANLMDRAARSGQLKGDRIFLGQSSGTDTVTLLHTEMPIHIISLPPTLTIRQTFSSRPLTSWVWHRDSRVSAPKRCEYEFGEVSIQAASSHNNMMPSLT